MTFAEMMQESTFSDTSYETMPSRRSQSPVALGDDNVLYSDINHSDGRESDESDKELKALAYSSSSDGRDSDEVYS